MHPFTFASPKQIDGIRSRAVNSDTRSFAWAGIALTHDQADDLGAAAIDWLRARFGLVVRTEDSAVLCEVAR